MPPNLESSPSPPRQTCSASDGHISSDDDDDDVANKPDSDFNDWALDPASGIADYFIDGDDVDFLGMEDPIDVPGDGLLHFSPANADSKVDLPQPQNVIDNDAITIGDASSAGELPPKKYRRLLHKQQCLNCTAPQPLPMMKRPARLKKRMGPKPNEQCKGS